MKSSKTPVILHGIGILAGLVLILWGYSEALFILTLPGLALMGYNIFKLVKRRTAPDIREDPHYRAEDDEHNRELDRLQGIVRMWQWGFRILCAVAVCLWLVAVFSGAYIPAVILSIAAAVCNAVAGRHRNKQKLYVAENIVRRALEEVFEIAEYLPCGCISPSTLRGSDFGIGTFDDASGTDYVRGTYNGLAVEMCDIHLTSRETRTDEEGRTEEYDAPVFDGFWLICDFAKELAADIRLWERGALGKLVGGSGIQTENEQFNKHFCIMSSSEVEAFYILTPHMMEYILEMDRKAGGETHIRFERGGRVHIAIRRKHDSFEMGKYVRDATLLRRQFVEEIRYITDLIDELRLVDTIYRKES